MNKTAYDDREALHDYIMRHAKHYMTDFEKRCVHLGILREKAEAADDPSLHELSRDSWSREGSDDMERALTNGVWDYQMQIRERLQREAKEGTLLVNRCPRCHGVARAPLAKQCRWCGHDWHDD